MSDEYGIEEKKKIGGDKDEKFVKVTEKKE